MTKQWFNSEVIGDDVMAVVVGKAFPQMGDIDPGTYPVDLTVSVTDNYTQTTTTKRVVGVVKREKDHLIAPTATIPWLTVCARLAISMGATHDNIVNKLREAILSATTGEVDNAIRALDMRVAGSIDQIKRELVEGVPKTPRRGSTKVTITEVTEDDSVEVVTNA